MKNPCTICKEKEGTCEDKEAGGFVCGECLANLIQVSFQLNWLDKYNVLPETAENPNDPINYEF